jgi:N-acetylmuramoyl-L-alanine amidase
MSKGEIYTIAAGDCLSGIAWMRGFGRWQTIYEAPENEKFRKKRPNPNVIYPGDELVIPEKEMREESCASEKRHHFKVHRSTWILRIELRDELFKGIENLPFVLEIPGGVKIDGKTRTNGRIETPVPAWAKTATLRLPGRQIALHLGGLDPVRQVTGVQQRLNNLGFNAGAVDGILGPKTRKAVAAFQATQPDLKATGALDDDTLRRLIELHDNDKRLSGPEDNAPPGETGPNSDVGGTPGKGGWTGEDMACRPPPEWGAAATPWYRPTA